MARLLATRAAAAVDPPEDDPATTGATTGTATGATTGTATGAPGDAGRADDLPDPEADDRPSTASRRPARGGGPGTSTGRSGRTRRGGGRTGRRPATSDDPDAPDGPPTTDAEHESAARAIVLRQLTAAPRSRHQLAEALARREIPERVADRVLDRFTEVGLIDDAAYAEMLVRSRHTERGLSRRALSMELRRKGVSPEDSAAALDQVDDEDEEAAARALARKKLRATRGLDRDVRLRRAFGALGRKGYGGSLVSRVVREELAAEDEAE